MYRQRRVPYPFPKRATRKVVWRVLRFVVLLAGAGVLGAASASQGASASTVARSVAKPTFGPSGDSASPSEPSGHRPPSGTSSLLVKFNTNFSADQARQLVTDDGGRQRATIPALGVVVVDVPSGQLQSIRGRYQKDKRVKSVELDLVRKAAATPSDPLYPTQWNLPQIGWDQVYGSVTPTGTATIAILDTGVDASHPDLAGHALPGYSTFAGSDPLTDPNGHGTWMAGIAAGATGNGTGVAGVAFSGVSIIPVQVLDSTGGGQDSDIVNGIIWATDNGANVILMPFSNPGFSQSLQDAISYAWSKGVVLVAATGNDASSSTTYPAGDADVVGVSATDQSDALWSGSNYGADTFIAAPGVGIPTTDVGRGYTTISGTSASAAMVAGAAAFERAVDPTASNTVIVGRLGQDADPAGTTAQTGNGRLNMQRVVADTSTVSAIPAGVPGGGPLLGPYVIGATTDSLCVTGASTAPFNTDIANPETAGTAFTVWVTVINPNKSCNGAGTSDIDAGYTGTIKFSLGQTDNAATVGSTPMASFTYTFIGSGPGHDNDQHQFTVTLFATVSSNNQNITGTDQADASIKGTSNNFRVNAPGPADHLIFSQNPSSATEGIAFGTQPQLEVVDSANHLVIGDNGRAITLSIGTNPASGVLRCTNTVVNDTNGVATFAGCSIDETGNGYALKATTTGLTTNTVTGATFNISDAAITASASAVAGAEGTSTGTVMVATFTDGNPFATAADFTASINWGDLSTSVGIITLSSGTFTVTATHTYLEEGSKTVAVTITDDDGASASPTNTATVRDPKVIVTGVAVSGH